MKKYNLFKKFGYFAIPVLAALILAFLVFPTNLFSTREAVQVHANNLMEGITPKKINSVKLDDRFIYATADFSIELFKNSYTKDKNSLISPLSVYLALGMTANGADGNTLKVFEKLLGQRSININDLNSYYNSLSNNLVKTKYEELIIANSIWFRNDNNLNVNKSFLQTNADYYNASIYKANFNNQATAQDINNWVKNNTGNKIDKIIDKTYSNDMMYLINAIYFEGQWKKAYDSNNISKDTFSLIDGTKKSVTFMSSTEKEYIHDDKVQGFIKPYKSGKFSFVALLPDKKINIYNYISSLSGEKFIELISNKSEQEIDVKLPKFKSEYKMDLVEPLKKMGLKECFDGNKADFNKMVINNSDKLWVGDILHKTYISVCEQGTKAAAVTSVGIDSYCIPTTINLNRPFLYAIIDNETKLPLFIGMMTDPTA